MIRLLNENNVSGKLPMMIDNFLQSFAQSYGKLDYSDIISLGNKLDDLSKDQIILLKTAIRKVRTDLKETQLDAYESSIEFEDIKEDCDNLVTVIKQIID